jgi:hypothetical protein
MDELNEGQPNNEFKPIRTAFIFDNVVADVLVSDERLAAIFLSNPLVIDITEFEDSEKIKTHSVYNPETNEFIVNSEIIKEKK